MKAEYGNAPLVDFIGINFAVTVRVGNHLAPSSKTNESTISLATPLFEPRAVTFKFRADRLKLPDTGHSLPSSKLDVIAAQEVILPIELPPGDIHVEASNAVVVMRRDLLELWEIADAPRPDRIHQVAAHDS